VREYDEPLGPVSINRERAQAIFFRRRHQPRRPPLAKISGKASANDGARDAQPNAIAALKAKKRADP